MFAVDADYQDPNHSFDYQSVENDGYSASAYASKLENSHQVEFYAYAFVSYSGADVPLPYFVTATAGEDENSKFGMLSDGTSGYVNASDTVSPSHSSARAYAYAFSFRASTTASQ